MRLPEFFVKLSPIGETLAAFETEKTSLEAEINSRNRQLTVSTADLSLHLWEQDYGLVSLGDLAVRRGRIRAAMTAGEQSMTLAALKQMVSAVGGADEVFVEEDFANGRVVIRGIFPDSAALTGLEETISRFKPAHLQVQINPTVELTGVVKLYPVLSGAMCVELCGTPEP